MPFDRLHPDFATPGKKPVGPVEVDWSNPLSRGLIGVWGLHLSGHNTVSGAPSLGAVPGRAFPGVRSGSWYFVSADNNALRFDNEGGRFNKSRDHSIVAAFNRPSVVSNKAIFSQQIGGSYFRTKGAKLNFLASNVADILTSTASYSAHTDVFAAVTISPDSTADIKMYIDGKSDASTTYANTLNGVGSYFHIGIDTTANLFDGDIHLVMYYDRELAEIEAREVTRDPYQIFRPAIPIPLFAPSAAVTGTGAGTFPTFTAAGVGEREAVGTGAATFAVFTAAGSGSTLVDLEGLTVVGSAPRLRISGSAPIIKASGKPPL